MSYRVTSNLHIKGDVVSPGQINLTIGSHFASIKIPNDLSSDMNFVLPGNIGNENQILARDATGKTERSG